MQRIFSFIIFVSLVLFGHSSMAGVGASGAAGTKHSGVADDCGGKKSKVSKDEVKKIAEKVHGNKATCYENLYDQETGSNALCYQTHTPSKPGEGICTLEGNDEKRNPRGGDCKVKHDEMFADTPEAIELQMKCCAHIMKETDRYFEPVIKGKVPNCETGASLSRSGGGGKSSGSSQSGAQQK